MAAATLMLPMPGRRRLPARAQPLPLTAKHQRSPVEAGDRVDEEPGVDRACVIARVAKPRPNRSRSASCQSNLRHRPVFDQG
jgi:hypothetical protein